MWRPENWENPCRGVRMTYDEQQLEKSFEAGADAMLEVLKDNGIFTYGNHTPDIDLNNAPEVSGYWAFIPDEK